MTFSEMTTDNLALMVQTLNNAIAIANVATSVPDVTKTRLNDLGAAAVKELAARYANIDVS